jgi:hypothetical protein
MHARELGASVCIVHERQRLQHGPPMPGEFPLRPRRRLHGTRHGVRTTLQPGQRMRRHIGARLRVFGGSVRSVDSRMPARFGRDERRQLFARGRLRVGRDGPRL